MLTNLLKYCSQFVELTEADNEKIKSSFHSFTIKRKGYLLSEGQICDFIAFINSGIIRHYHIKNGNEITCDITLSNSFITDFKSFTLNIPSTNYFQVLKDVELLVIKKKDLFDVYSKNKNIETLGRIMAEKVAQRTIDIAMSLASDKPEERVEKLLAQQSELFQLVPQRYLANLLGISPESLSRIRARKSIQKKS